MFITLNLLSLKRVYLKRKSCIVTVNRNQRIEDNL